MKYKEFTNKPEAEVRRMVEEMRQQAEEPSQKIKLNQEKQTHKLKALKKDIARALTYLHTMKS